MTRGSPSDPLRNFYRLVTSHNYATFSSFVAAVSIGSKVKPLKDGEFLKNAFINCPKNLFNNFAKKKYI